MRLGFTGTREGLSNAQWEQLRYVLGVFRAASNHAHYGSELELHHGDGEGFNCADQQAKRLAEEFGYKPVPHPPSDTTSAAMLARNREIALVCDVLVAAPRRDREEQRSGTWATVRYTRALRKPVIQLTR